MIWINLRMFAMTYLHQEYGIKGFEALKESFTLMKGHCTDLLLINLSFIGWILLCAIISIMIGGVFGDNGIPPDIPQRHLAEWIHRKYHNLKQGVQRRRPQSKLCKP